MEQKKIIINGQSVNYKTFGAGAPVLVLHGWGKGSDAWAEFGILLAKKGYQVIIPDLPGFGESEAPITPWVAADYLRFVENFVFELELEKIYLIGHSFGGGLAALVVAHNPALAKRLILVDAAVVRRERLGLRQQAAKTMAAAKGIFSRLPFADKLRPLAEKIVYRIAGTHDYQKTNGVMRETFKNILAEDLTSSADFIKIPTLLVWGDFDDSTPVEDGRELNRRIGGSILRLVENCGHNPHVTHTTELVRVVSEFIKSGN